jgi:elongation factor 2
MGELIVAADEGNVCFGSGKDCWAFTLTKFARIYSKKFKTEMEKLRKRFWGDNYYDAKAKVWTQNNTSKEGKEMKRAFV